MTVIDVAAPVIGSLSPSRAGDFKACPLRYRFRVLDKLPQRSSPAAVRGTLVHAVLERLFDLPAADRTAQAASEMIPAQWQRLLADNPEMAELFTADAGEASVPDLLSSAGRMLGGYFLLEDPQRLEPVARECLVEVVLDSGLQLRGYVDRLDQSPGGDLRIVDYKTGRLPGESFEAAALFQLKFYALVMWRTSGRVPRELRLLYLGEPTMLRYAPDEPELRAFERLVGALWQAIARATETGDFRPRPGAACNWCDHRSLCPEWGGTPPELPSVHPSDDLRVVPRQEAPIGVAGLP